MGAVHIEVHHVQDSNLQQGIDPGTVQQTGDVDGDGPQVESEQIGIFHQWQTARTEILTQCLGHVLGIGPFCLHLLEERLEPRGALFLTLAVVGIVVVEDTVEQFLLRQILLNLPLLGVVVEFTPLLAQEEIEMYLTVIVG